MPILGEARRTARPGASQPVLDVGARLRRVHRLDVVGGNDPLPELRQSGTLQDFTEFGLPDEKAAQQGLVAELEVRQRAQLLDGLDAQILRFVDDQQTALALAGQADQKGFQGVHDVRFVDPLGVDAECGADQAQGVVGIAAGAHQMRRDDLVRIQAVEHPANDRRLAHAQFAGNDHETFVLLHAVLEIRGGAQMRLARKIELRIGVCQEGLAAQAIERRVFPLAQFPEFQHVDRVKRPGHDRQHEENKGKIHSLNLSYRPAGWRGRLPAGFPRCRPASCASCRPSVSPEVFSCV